MARVRWDVKGGGSREVWGAGTWGVAVGAGWAQVQVAGVRWEREGVRSREVLGAGTGGGGVGAGLVKVQVARARWGLEVGGSGGL